jgi:cytoskeletal protein CcmA (bactofilin family)
MKIGNSRRDMGTLKNDWQTRDDDDLPEELEPEISFKPASTTSKRWEDQIERPASPEECSSVIGNGSVWQGNFQTDGSVRLDGKVSGEIKAAGTVHVSKGAQVNAVIQARFVVMGGIFDGQIYCSEHLELQPTSHVKGSMTTPQISVGEGAFIDGEIHMVEETPAAQQQQQPKQQFAQVKPVSTEIASARTEDAEPETKANGFQTGNVTQIKQGGQQQIKR